MGFSNYIHNRQKTKTNNETTFRHKMHCKKVFTKVNIEIKVEEPYST